MTESQRRWEAWFSAFSQLHAAWPDKVDVPCPESDGARLRAAYLGDPVSRIGTAFAWCETGRHGIYVSRVAIPPGADMLPFDAPDSEQDLLIPPDIEFLPPDPAPPSDQGEEDAGKE
jgi:hypothetical protein